MNTDRTHSNREILLHHQHATTSEPSLGLTGAYVSQAETGEAPNKQIRDITGMQRGS